MFATKKCTSLQINGLGLTWLSKNLEAHSGMCIPNPSWKFNGPKFLAELDIIF